MAFSSDRGVRGVAELNNVNGASALEGMEGQEAGRETDGSGDSRAWRMEANKECE